VVSEPLKDELSDQVADEVTPAVSSEHADGASAGSPPQDEGRSPDASSDAPGVDAQDVDAQDVDDSAAAPEAAAASAEGGELGSSGGAVESPSGVESAASDSEQTANEYEEDEDEDAEGIPVEVEAEDEPNLDKQWFILKVQVNREDSIRDAIVRRVKIEGLEEHFGEIIVPTEDVVEFTKSGKRRVVKRKLYPGYILANMALTDDTWFIVRETPGVGDFTGSAGKPTPMDPHEVERILRLGKSEEDEESQIRTAIPFKVGQRVRVKDGNFQNFEGDVESIDEANGRITVVITIFNRSTPVELEHYQLEEV
jgi:transcriptional antiterminator NusG